RDRRSKRKRGVSLAAWPWRSRHDRSEMTADYIQSRQEQQTPTAVRRFVLPLLIALVILVALLFASALLPLRQGRDAWLRGNDAAVIAIGEKWSRFHLWPAQYHQLLAAAYLASGNRAAALPHL